MFKRIFISIQYKSLLLMKIDILYVLDILG